MAGTTPNTRRSAGTDDAELQNAYRMVSDVLAGAVRETLAAPGPDPARFAVRRLTAVDRDMPPDATPPGWSLAFLVLADWYDAARIYRAWAVTAPWCAKGPMHQRED